MQAAGDLTVLAHPPETALHPHDLSKLENDPLTNRRKTVLLGIDQGTTNTKALVIDDTGSVLGASSRAIALAAPGPGVVEQDAGQMYANVLACAGDALAKAEQKPENVAGLGISSQTETLVVWDRRTGEPAMPAMVWQCRRGQHELEHLGKYRKLIRTRTGLDLDPTFTAAKLMWVAVHRPEIMQRLRQGLLLWGTVDCWLRWKLTGGEAYATEPGNASRTMFFDIGRCVWDEELASLFGLSLTYPDVTSTTARHGLTLAEDFGASVPVTAFLGDQQASLFGHGCFSQGETKVTYGTGAFIWMNRGPAPGAGVPDGLLRTIAWQMDETVFALEGFVMSAGATLDWMARCMALSGGGAGVARAAAEAGGSEGVIVVPAFQGLASPWWRPEARALITGLSAATRSGHIAHAALESVAWQVKLLLDEMGMARSVSVDGGMTGSAYFLQLQADVLGLPLSRASEQESSALGAALAAGIGAGIWKNPAALRNLIRHHPPVEPRPDPNHGAYETWRRWVDVAVRVSTDDACRRQ